MREKVSEVKTAPAFPPFPHLVRALVLAVALICFPTGALAAPAAKNLGSFDEPRDRGRPDREKELVSGLSRGVRPGCLVLGIGYPL